MYSEDFITWGSTIDLTLALIEYCQQHGLLSTDKRKLAKQLLQIGKNHGVTHEDIIQVL